ncbi:hypothetical protein D3C77_37670 [compost metagenome]
MPDQANLFEAQPQVTQQQVEAQQQTTSVDTQLVDLLTGIKNESGQQKYDSVPKALEGLAHAQQYIPQLKSELVSKDQEIATLREELAKRTAVEDVVTRLTAAKVEQQEPGTPATASGLTEEAVLQLVQNVLVKQKVHDQAAQNTAQVQQALIQRYGDKSREVVETKAKELGLTAQKLGQLASENPQLVLALFNASPSAAVKPTTGSQHLPSTYQPVQSKLERPTKSLLSGSTSAEQKEFMAKVKADVYARLGVES